jgi:hypothetical protein
MQFLKGKHLSDTFPIHNGLTQEDAEIISQARK